METNREMKKVEFKQKINENDKLEFSSLIDLSPNVKPQTPNPVLTPP